MEMRNMPLETIVLGERTIYLLGTAHISEESVKDVEYAIEHLTPDVVAVELDENRRKKLMKEDSQWKEMNMFEVIKNKKAMFLLSSIVLSSFQRRLGENLSVAPGQEMLTALQECQKKGINYILADRSAELTLKRAWNKASFWGRQKIFATLIASVFSKETVSEEDLNEMKQKSSQGHMLEEISKYLPQFKEVLLDERDEYLAMNIFEAKGNTILAVLGAAHVPGIKARIEALEKSQSTQDTNNPELQNSQQELQNRKISLEQVPDAKRRHIINYIIPLAIIGLFGYSFYRGGASKLVENFSTWVFINGGLSLAGAILALAHPVTMLVSFIAAPLTSLTPVVGVGLVTGLSETFFRAPRVKDFEELQVFTLSLKKLYKNRITRILLVFFLTSLGSVIGTWTGLTLVASNVS